MLLGAQCIHVSKPMTLVRSTFVKKVSQDCAAQDCAA